MQPRHITRAVSQILTAVLLIFPVVCVQRMEAQDLKALQVDLQTAYAGKFLSLKSPQFGSKLRFDSSGSLIGRSEPGPWTTCGLLQAHEVLVRPDHLEIKSKRVLLALRQKGATPMMDAGVVPVVTDEEVRVIVELSASDFGQVNRVLSLIFESGDLLQRFANCWKPKTADLNEFRRTNPDGVVAELEGQRPVYLGNKNTQPPRALYTPDPSYSPGASKKGLEGTTLLTVIVNEKGFPEILEISRPLGEGLDVQALATVAGWRFRPAMKNGKPVAVIINVQVAFRLY